MVPLYSTGYRGVSTEAERHLAPTEQHYQDLRILLKDFGLKDISIPKFKTVSEMEIWRKHILLTA